MAYEEKTLWSSDLIRPLSSVWGCKKSVYHLGQPVAPSFTIGFSVSYCLSVVFCYPGTSLSKILTLSAGGQGNFKLQELAKLVFFFFFSLSGGKEKLRFVFNH